MNKDYEALLKIGREAHTLRGIGYLLSWDQETYMPHDAALSRAEQLELMASLLHKSETGKPFVNALSKLINIESGEIIATQIDPAQKAALKEWRRSYLNLAKLPNAFVKAFAKLSSEATHVWAKAKKENSFESFAPYLERIIDMSRKKADYLGYDDHPYDALLDEYEPGMTTAQVSKLFIDLKKPITALIKKIAARPQLDASCLVGEFSHDTQMQAAVHFLTEMGYDFTRGRIDLTSHPFSTTMHPRDSRVTTRLDPKNFMNNISTVLHEGGHALYEMGLPEDHFGSPLCEAVSLGIHESQSRFWETRIGQSKAFWKIHLPYLKKIFPGALSHASLETFYKAINQVTPGFIRVDADEVTYSLHVVLRFELERALIEGSLKVRDIPHAWNAKMKEYLGLTPRTDSEGCLQDIHWAMGGFGYFPTYTLGNMFASHFFLGFEKEFPNWEERMSCEGLGFIREWLRAHVHSHGKQYSSLDLARRITGVPFSAKAFVSYLESKYHNLYGLG